MIEPTKEQMIEKLARAIVDFTILGHVSSKSLAVDLIDAGYRLVPELKIMDEEETRRKAVEARQKGEVNNGQANTKSRSWRV